jgi:hypothetical protein
MSNEQRVHANEIRLRDIADWAKWAAWGTLLFGPLLYAVHGPAVSKDQLVVRTSLLLAAGAIAISFGVARAIRRLRRPESQDTA